MKTNKTDYILSEMPVGNAMMKIGMPAIFAMMIMAIYNLVDTMYIARLDSENALSVVSIAFPIMALMTALGQILGAGSASAIGRAFGKGENKYASRVATTTIYTSLVSGLVFAMIGLLFTKQIFLLFGASSSIITEIYDYGTWMFIGAIFAIPNQTFNNIARAETKASLSMFALTIGAVLNIILDPILMFNMNLGLRGASIATTISQGVSFVFIASFFFLGKTKVKVKIKNFNPCGKIYSDVLRSGVPIGVTQILTTLAVSITNNVALNVALTEQDGIIMQSAYGVVLKIICIFQYVAIGFFQGYQPIASYSYGSKNKRRFFTAFRYTTNFVLCYSMIVSTITIFFSKQIVTLVAPGNVNVIEVSAKLLSYHTVFFLLLSLTLFLMFTFQATGLGKDGAIIALSRQGFVYIPILIVSSQIIGIDSIYYAQPLSDVITTLICVVLYFRFKKHLQNYFSA